MQTTTTDPDGRAARRSSSTGPVAATWVAGTGAFLLLAAAAVFIAVSWARLPEAAKLALVGAITGACMAGGRVLRRTLLATGDVLFHLGALLLPIDLAGLALRASVGWRAIVVAEGVLGVGVLGALAAATGSVVLTWAAIASMVVLAVGVAAVTPVPAVAALALAALAAHLLGRRRPALAWSTIAALGPVLGFAVATALAGTGVGHGVLADLGTDRGLAALAGCLVAAVVLGREARARHDVALAGLAAGGAVGGLVTTWANAGISAGTTVLSLPVAFLVIEVVALLCERDPFWRHPARGGSALAETGAIVVGGLWTAGLVLAAPIVETGLDLMSDVPGWEPRPTTAASLAVLAVGWTVAGLRRSPTAPTVAGAVRATAGAPFAAVWCAVAVVAAVEVGTASGPATAVALVAAAAALLWTAAPVAQAAGAGLAFWAPLALVSSPSLAMAAGTAAAAAVVLGAVASSGTGPAWRLRLLGAAGLVTAVVGTALAIPVLTPGLALAVVVVQAWAVAALLGVPDPTAGNAARLGLLAGAGLALALTPSAGVPAVAVPPPC